MEDVFDDVVEGVTCSSSHPEQLRNRQTDEYSRIEQLKISIAKRIKLSWCFIPGIKDNAF